jgi:hypothetical protein
MTRFADRLWKLFEEGLFSVPSSEVMFNQYRDTDIRFDLPGGAAIRRQNLRNYISSYPKPPRVLLVGEAAGPWGARFSGIPFTGERLLVEGKLPFEGSRSSNHEPPYTEASGTIFWGALLQHFPDFMVWNSVPLHPHRPGQPLSIRSPGKSEIMAFSGLLMGVIEEVRPARVAAIGRNAEYALGRLGIEARYVRHPSQSGARAFRAGIVRIFRPDY